MTANPDLSAEALEALTSDLAVDAVELDRTGAFPRENFRKLGTLGLLGLTAPLSLGGAEASLRDCFRLVQAVAKGEPSTALILAMQLSFQQTIAQSEDWPDHLKTLLGRGAVERGELVNGLSVEPDLGTPQRGGLPATRARWTGGEWRLDGHKIFSTGAEGLRWMAVVARMGEEERSALFVVRSDAPGIMIEKSWNHLGMRATGSHDVLFRDVPVGRNDLVPFRPLHARAQQAGQWIWSSVLTVAIYDAVARVARDDLLRLLQDRGAGATVAERLGEIEAILFNSQVLLNHVIRGIETEAGLDPGAPGLTKHLVTTGAIRAVDLARRVAEEAGLAPSATLDRHYRNVLCGRVHTPQSDFILAGAARQALSSQKGISHAG